MKPALSGYKFLEPIGSGTFGKVYRAMNTQTGEPCAIKVLSLNNMSSRALAYKDREVEILRSLSHENITRLLEVFATYDYEFLVFEYCNGGDLTSYLKSHGGRLSESLVRDIIQQVVKAMNVLNQLSLIHRDIKLSNVFLHFPNTISRQHDKPVVKLGDFGFARELSVGDIVTTPETSLEMSCVGTPLNMAPEVTCRQPYSFKADIWSLGTITYELICGHPCFNGRTHSELTDSITAGVYKIRKDLKVSHCCMDFIASCLVEDSESRISWDQVMIHPFISGDSKPTLTPNNNEWLKEDGKYYIFSTKKGDKSKYKKEEYRCNGYNVTFSEVEYGFVKVDTVGEEITESDFVVI